MTPEGKARVLIGTSGWSYDHWEGPFYPEGLASAKRLEFYSQHFSTVEINTSFYHIPQEKTVFRWKEIVPENFAFAVKAPRFITHMQKLKEPRSARRFIERMEALGDKLEVVLFQLPPFWSKDALRLSRFLAHLPKNHRYAFEFREASWYDREVYSILEQGGAALTSHDLHQIESPIEVTAEFTYLRFHGTIGTYGGKYSRLQLARQEKRIRRFLAQGLDVYAYFNNDERGFAVENAKELAMLLEPYLPPTTT